jgi:plastocyanin
MRTLAFITIGILAGAASAALAQEVPVDAELEEVCAEAEKRFVDQGGTRPAGKVTVLMYKYRFCPPNVTVKAGTTVRWINVDKRTSHSVWLKEAGVEESPRMFNFETWEFPFVTPGKYPYICGPHGVEEKMVGHVTVTP